MSELVINIGGDGCVDSLYSEEFDISFLGEKTVRRQCDIVFKADTQRWDIEYIHEDGTRQPTPLQGFTSYKKAQTLEVAWLNDCRIVGVPPVSPDGCTLAEMILEFKGQEKPQEL